MDNKSCMVCNGPLEKGLRVACKECKPFWEKASNIIKDKKRKPVEFDVNNMQNNKALFAQEMKKSWDSKKPHYLCKYTWLRMEKYRPKVKRRDGESEEHFKKRAEESKLLEYLVCSPDRIDSDLNYKKDNVEVCSYLGNIMKNALKVEAFDSVIRGIIMSKLNIGKDEELAKMLLQTISNFYSDKKFTLSELRNYFEIDEEK